MMVDSKSRIVLVTLAAAGLVCAVGCESADQQGDTAPDQAVMDKLEAADELDGTADRVVSRCAGCALGMEGEADHALDLHGYELHFCSESCREVFSEKIEDALLALAIPEG